MLKRVEGLFTYQEAILVCESLGAKLFEPKEFDHIKYIWPIIPNQEFGQGLFWTGITDEEEEGKYVEIQINTSVIEKKIHILLKFPKKLRYIFESSKSKLTYDLEWASLQPSNNEGADFVYFKYPDQKVYNGDKSRKVEVLCEKV